MVNVDHEAVAAFIVDAWKRLAWIDRELARLHDEGDRRALAGAREELVRVMATVANKLERAEARGMN